MNDIANAPWLTVVSISGHEDYAGEIDLSFVAHLPELESLSLDELGPIDAQAIQSNSLSSLNLTNSQPNDYVFVAALENLQNLHLNNALDRLASLPLDGLNSLTGLAIINSEIASIAGIERLENLNRLAITNTAVSDLAPLSGLNLTHVTLASDKIEDLSPLGNSTEITHLVIKGSGITSLDGLSLGPSLVHIDGSESELSDISAMQTATNVERALFENANITDVMSLAGKSHLQQVDLRKNPVSDLSAFGIGAFPNLTILDLSDTLVFDLSPLHNLTSVERLSLSRIPATDLTPLAGMASVEALWLNDTPADDLSPLLNMPALEGFIVDDQQFVTKENLPAYMETR
ncbi:internalin A [Yoonia tamlensis]|uniref:Internalin A n=1 Tax=Yoonia tamlensis TaxID=390270 RepID=A0A1I6HPH9_9RHOB|nr:internalin A [Yoonia tamlensis]